MRCASIAPVRRLAAILIGVVAVGASALADDEVRTWKDASGKFTIKARLLAVEDGKVSLEREDGTEIEIELKKLCTADQKYVADRPRPEDDPFKPVAPKDPFKARAKSKSPSAGAMKAPPSEPRVVVPDWSKARALVLAPDSQDWKIDVTPSPPTAAAIKARPIGLPSKADFFERAKGMVVSGNGKMALVGYNLDNPKPLGVTRVVECDLEKGKLLGSASTPGLMRPLALNDDGSQVLMCRDEFGFGNNDRLEFWSLSNAGIAKDRSFVPYGDINGGDRDVKWAAFLGEKTFATVSSGGKLAVWDLDSLDPIYYLTIENGCVPALSADRKRLAFTTAKEVGVLDVAEGQVLALREKPFAAFPKLAISPSGKRLALGSADKLRVYDMATGTLERDILLTGLFAGDTLQWTGETYVLVGGQFVIDVENQVKMWAYQGAELSAPNGAATLFAITPHNAVGAMIPAALPHAGAIGTLKQAMADPNFFVLKPGSTVKLDVTALADPGERNLAATALATALRKNEAQVGPNGAATLVATTEVGKEREITYRTFGSFGEKTYKIREHISRVKLVYGGQVAWETSVYNIPHFVSLKEGQTMEAYLREQEKPNYAFFGQVELPKFVTRPTGGATVGTSQVSASGIR